MSSNDLPDVVSVKTEDLRYLIKVADWVVGEGFCNLPYMEDPEEWLFRRYEEAGLPDGYDYDSDEFLKALTVKEAKP